MSTSADAEGVDLVRRRLLLAGARYAAPAVLVAVMAGEAYAASCGPAQNNCNPVTCAPAGTCDPDSNCAPFNPPAMM